MVKGATYYAKFQTNPSIQLSGYSATYQLKSKGAVVMSGPLTLSGDYFELTFQTAALNYGPYQLLCFVTFPDGYIQVFNDEEIIIK